MMAATATAFDRIIDALHRVGRQVKHDRPNHAMAQCPAHDDRNPSLSVTGTDSQAMLHCFAGCHPDDVLAALGMASRDLFNEPMEGPYGLGPAIRYTYPDGRENWRSVIRKDFRRNDSHARTEGPKLLYRSDVIGDAEHVYVCEGEKDADAVAAAGGIAVACPGAQSPAGFDWTILHGRRVTIVADKDEAGRKFAATIAGLLAAHADVRIATAKTGKDAADHVAANLPLDALEYDDPDAAAKAAEEALVQHMARGELLKLKARKAARDAFDAELRPVAEPFDLDTLTGVLSRPEPPPARVERLMPWESSTLITAQRKTGKTTLTLNLTRALITGEPFLGELDVRRCEGPVAFLNYEVSAHQIARWADDVRVPGDRLILVNLRGRRNPLTFPEDREALAGILHSRGVETVIVDPFGRAFSGKSQNDASEVAPWLVALDRFKTECGALDLILTAHAGWNGERTRGSSALEDWADSIWTLTRDDGDDGAGERYLRAIGRDVDLEEDRLHFDTPTRTLTLSGSGNRKAAAKARHIEELAKAAESIIAANPRISGNKVAQELREGDIPHQRGDHIKALRLLVDRGVAVVEDGPRQAKLYSLTPTYPQLTPGATHPLTPTSPIGVGVGGVGAGQPNLPRGTCTVCRGRMVDLGDGATTHPGCEQLTPAAS